MTAVPPADAQRSAADAKTLAMERSVAILRALVIGTNVVVYLLFLRGHTPRPALAWTIIGIAVPYAIWSLAMRPYLRYPLLRFGAVTLVSDTILITLWILATGSERSEFWIIYAVSAISAGMRYDLVRSLIVGVAESAVYLIAMALDHGLPASSAVLRPAYIVIAAVAAGMAARQERTTREERVQFEQLAAEHSEMLARERQTVDSLRDLDLMKTTFISAVSHEVRTPLTAVLGFAKTLEQRRDALSDTEQSEILTRIINSGERLERILMDLLDLNAFANGVAQLHRSPTRIVDVVARVLDEVEVGSHPIETIVDPRLSAPLDAAKVDRILSNLVRNAVKYSPADSPVTIRAERTGSDTLLTVEDRGAGIPEDFKHAIFDVFRQGPNKVAHAPGTGVGLALVARLAELHGGRAWVEDRPGGGSSFNVLLPDGDGIELFDTQPLGESATA